MTGLVANRHVDFEKPPVVEVVCGIIFEPIPGFSASHYGLLWQSYAEDFPKTSDQPRIPFPLSPIRPGQQIQVPISFGVQLPRVWFLSEDERQLIQVQPDRFNFNWRRREDSDDYPTFPIVYESFWRYYEKFQALLAGEVEEPRPVQYELTYINHIPVDDVWGGFSDLGSVLPDVSWRSEDGRFLPKPVNFKWDTQFPMPDGAGVLTANASSARLVSTGELAITLNLSARGPAGVLDVHKWFDLGHEWITRGFTDLTGREMHSKVWKRKGVKNG